MKVLIIASEAAPYAKTGGMGDVTGSLPAAVKKLGADVRVVLPKYRSIKSSLIENIIRVADFDVRLSWRTQRAGVYVKYGETPVYFIENDYYFGRDMLYGYPDDNERFAFFCKAAIEMLTFLDFVPDVIHCNDWQTAPVCLLLKKLYDKILPFSGIRTLFTIHNLQYQGNFDKSALEFLDVPFSCFENGDLEFYGRLSYIKAGLIYSDMISTVSRTYSLEIQTARYGYGMDGILRSRNHKLFGILNGIDYALYDPETDGRIYKNYGSEDLTPKKENKALLQKELGLPVSDVPVISMVSRLAEQKGFDILAEAMDRLMEQDIQFVILGTGETRYEELFRGFAERYRDKISVSIKFDDTLAQKIYAGGDMFLMPSMFEPCGLSQLISLRYGTVPIVRKTGGLADTISDFDPETGKGNGFVFEDYDAGGLIWGVTQALKVYESGGETWEKVVRNAMDSDHSWENSAKEYLKLYKRMMKNPN